MSPGWRRSHDQRSTDKFLVNLRFLIDKFVVCAAVLLGSFAEDPHVGAEGVVVALDPGVGVRRPSHGFPDAGKDWCDDVVTRCSGRSACEMCTASSWQAPGSSSS